MDSLRSFINKDLFYSNTKILTSIIESEVDHFINCGSSCFLSLTLNQEISFLNGRESLGRGSMGWVGLG